MDDEFTSYEMKCGFKWGPVTVTRMYTHPNEGDKRAVWLSLQTDRQELTVHITPTGLIRVGEGPVKRVNPVVIQKKTPRYKSQFREAKSTSWKLLVSTSKEDHEVRSRALEEALQIAEASDCSVELQDEITDFLREMYIALIKEQRSRLASMVRRSLGRRTEATKAACLTDFLSLHDKVELEGKHRRDLER